MSKNMNYDKKDELALRNSAIPTAVMNSEGVRFDSAEDVSVFPRVLKRMRVLKQSYTIHTISRVWRRLSTTIPQTCPERM